MKTTPSFRLLTLVGAVAFVLSAPFGKAILLDWDTLTWAPNGALTQSYDIDPTNPGSDVTITIGGPNVGSLISSTPRLGTSIDGGTGQSALMFFQGFTTAGQSLTVTVDFHYGLGVLDVDYTIFDVDRSTQVATSVDQINSPSGALVGGGSVAPTTFTGSVANSVVGLVATGTSTAGNTTSDGNVRTTFGGGAALNQFVFTYAAGPGTGPAVDSPNEAIALGDISFTPVPEAGTVAACAVASLIGIWGLRRMRRTPAEA